MLNPHVPLTDLVSLTEAAPSSASCTSSAPSILWPFSSVCHLVFGIAAHQVVRQVPHADNMTLVFIASMPVVVAPKALFSPASAPFVYT
jgi:hypothetical protein